MLQLRRAVSVIQALISPTTRDLQDQDTWLPYEQRRSHRYELELLLTATTSDGTAYCGYSRDVSENGTAAYIGGELSVGEEVLLSYKLPKAESLASVRAIVRHATGSRYGLEFCADKAVAKEDGFGKLIAPFPKHFSRLTAEIELLNLRKALYATFENN